MTWEANPFCFWLASACLVVLVCWLIRERAHQGRQNALKLTANRERLRECERNHILEMVLSNEPLGTILDAVLRLIHADCPNAQCAILLKRDDECHIAASAGVAREWLAAFRAPNAIPLDVWRKALWSPRTSSDA